MRFIRLLTFQSITACIALWSCASLAADVLPAQTSPDFGREVRPILARHCFKCHGPDPDARESGLRLDQQEDATADLGGYAAVVPGDPSASEIIARVTDPDEETRMPPGESLSAAEIETLRRWIASGGRYEAHWAFAPPTKPAIPDVNRPDWCHGAIDRLLLGRLEQAKLQPSPTASRTTLIRRLYLDLCGITPTPDEVDRFVHDEDPKAYRKLVDRLLATPEYAERFARPWLDLARYSDTNGYEKDRPRSIWPFRDWVIQAIAADMPYDEFSIRQLAGDMLPDASLDDRIATGFHRNTMLNEEGGIDPQEYRFYALVDRVATTGTVWMGLTTGCAQCHTHKYDPITHTDYYSLLALLNNADEPDVIVETPEQRRRNDEIQQQIRQAEQALVDQHLPDWNDFVAGNVSDEGIAAEFVSWLEERAGQTRHWQTIRPETTESTMPKLTVLDDDSVLASGDVTKRDVYRMTFQLGEPHHGATALRLEVLPHHSLPAGGPGMAFYEGRRGDFFLSELSVAMDGQPIQLVNPSHSFGKISVGSGSADAANVLDGEGSTGWSTSGAEAKANQLVVNFGKPLAEAATIEIEMLFERHFAAALGRFRFSLSAGSTPALASTLPQSLYQWYVDSDPHSIQSDDYMQLQRHFVRTAPSLKDRRTQIDQLERSMADTVRTLGMKERSPEDYRITHRHHRGEYLQPREPVAARVPEVFPPLGDSSPADRLALARWLVSEKNPLVGRVTANRAWRQFFGSGIVKTAGDFGTQSEPPSHPELLDWLATDLRSGGWSMKRLHRQIVLSAAYQQAIGPPPVEDPDNRLYSTFPHRRLTAEQIRDSLLSASGLLSRRVGGASVYPPQPKSVMQMAYGSPAWNVSTGGDRYRRSLYTFSKRTAPFAAFATFDGPTGELCIARRDRSTTPLQALTLLNDEMYLEIARGLAESTLREVAPPKSPRKIAERLFRKLLVRQPDAQELDAIVDFFQQQKDHREPWTLVARALINTDEAIASE